MAQEKTFLDHTKELRRRLALVFGFFLVALGVAYAYRDLLIKIAEQPLHQQLYYTSPGGGFEFIFKICFIFALIASAPFIMYQLIKFVEPTFSSNRSVRARGYLVASMALGSMGTAFAYFVLLPTALTFLNQFDQGQLQSLITVNSYLSFVGAFVAGFALLFQMPLILLLVNNIQTINPGSLWRRQGWVILVIFTLAAVLTPTPDPFNQSLFAAPIILLFEISILIIWLVNRKLPKGQSRWIKLWWIRHKKCGQPAWLWSDDYRIIGCDRCVSLERIAEAEGRKFAKKIHKHRAKPQIDFPINLPQKPQL